MTLWPALLFLKSSSPQKWDDLLLQDVQASLEDQTEQYSKAHNSSILQLLSEE